MVHFIMKVIFATGNHHKVNEVSRICPSVTFLSLKDVGIEEEIPETGSTFRANAQQKAQYVFDRTNTPALAEDSGLVVEALNGAPGVFSARYAGDEKNHQKNMMKLLSELSTHTNRRAYFISTFCFYENADKIYFFEGKCHGTIAKEMSGSGGFGYDPIFIPDGHKHTFGQLSDVTKDAMSHRKKSLVKLLPFLEKH